MRQHVRLETPPPFCSDRASPLNRKMAALLLPFALIAAASADAPPATRIEAPRPVIHVTPAPAVPVGTWPEVPPPMLRPRVVREPDWNDYNVYPPGAAELGQEGRVVADIVVGTDGVPRACRVVQFSGHAELDNGTCQLMLQMRFEPPRDGHGRPSESLVRRGFVWLLTDQTAFAPARMIAQLTLRDGAVADCAIEQVGAVPSTWMRRGCAVLRQSGDYYFAGPSLRRGKVKATAVLDLQPDGAQALPAPSQGRLVAMKRIEFEISPEGDPHNCRTSREYGFASTPALDDHGNPCGFFVTSGWFEPADSGGSPLSGSLEIKIYREP